MRWGREEGREREGLNLKIEPSLRCCLHFGMETSLVGTVLKMHLLHCLPSSDKTLGQISTLVATDTDAEGSLES